MASLQQALESPLHDVLLRSGALKRMTVDGTACARPQGWIAKTWRALRGGSDASMHNLADGRSGLRPLMLFIETINACNSACVFCPYSMQTRPQGVMSDALFDRLLDQYLAMGGGNISVSPIVGEALLDPSLPRRLRAFREAGERLTPSVTTNLCALGRWDDDVVVEALHTFRRMYVSCYGITEEENLAITRKKLHAVFCGQMRRLLRLRRESGSGMGLEIGFRTIHDYSASQLAQFQEAAFGEVLKVVGPTFVYNNWGGTMRGPLPGEARWVEARENHSPCLALMIAMQVYHDGRVTACPCCDFDANPELLVGNVSESTLGALFNGEKNSRLWRAQQAGDMPAFCRHCTFHRPMMDLDAHHPLLADLAAFIGG